jgi:hypothetical protein
MLLTVGEKAAKASIVAEAWLILVMRVKIAVVAQVSTSHNTWSNIRVYRVLLNGDIMGDEISLLRIALLRGAWLSHGRRIIKLLPVEQICYKIIWDGKWGAVVSFPTKNRHGVLGSHLI